MSNNTIIWYTLAPAIVLYMVGDMILSSLLYGGLPNTLIDGGSVANARDANVSIIKLTHNISMAFKGDSFNTSAPKNDMNRATRLTVN